MVPFIPWDVFFFLQMESFYFTCPPWAYCFMLHQQNSMQVWSGSKMTKFRAFKKISRASGWAPNTCWSPDCMSVFNWINVWTGSFVQISCVHDFTKGLNFSADKNLANNLNLQPVSRACCPVPVLGGVIRPSAPHWHEPFMFILNQSACLFIKGFDQSTPWPPGSNDPHSCSRPVHFISQPIWEYPLFLWLSFFSELFLLLFSPSFCFFFASLFHSPCLEVRPTVESFCCLMMVWVPS